MFAMGTPKYALQPLEKNRCPS